MTKTFLRPLIITLCILILPLIGTLTVEGWNWDVFDFLVIGVLLFVAGLVFELIAKQSKSPFYKYAVATGVITTVLLIWVNLAVGIIGDGNNMSASYFFLIPVGIVGLIASRLHPRGLSDIAFFAAAWMLIVPCIALLVGNQDIQQTPGPFGVFVLSAGFAFWYAVAGVLFRKATGSIAAK